ncbi:MULTISPECIES: tripartite tricarboxylate transporter substrate-binding protein [unclassified Mesorhizobium]|uniref:tripartite tricarboxylate transporter substrate-binding protein n=1 Tax=unclassified Mesorhizobium TaxID=325217 RepID=UPI001FED2E40|nr:MULTISPECIES: tripartite tricarboxylate transporter substrate-binding protein [unclassified Mesorhizobium]
MRLAQELGADVSKINTAVFGGASESTVALLGNNIDFSISGGETFAGYQKSGELKCVAVSGEGRLGGELADVPTLKELGVALSYSPTRGVIAPGGLSTEQIAFWDKTLKSMSESAAWKQAAEKAYWRVDYKDSKAATEANAKDRDELRAVYSTLGIIKK